MGRSTHDGTPAYLQINFLERRNAELEDEIDRLRQWQRDMVAKAAEGTLDGYREMGQKLAEKEAEVERLIWEVERQKTHARESWERADQYKAEVERLRELLRKAYPYVEDYGTDTLAEQIKGELT